MKKVLSAFSIMMIIILFFSACGKKQASSDITETFSIETPYCELRYPEKWKNTISVDTLENSTDTVRFSMDGVSVFDITFGKGDTFLGTLTLNGETTEIYVLFYQFEKDDKNYELYAAMQDDVNVITQNLVSDYGFVPGHSLLEDDGETFAIETSVVTLYYPQRWKDIVTVDNGGNTIAFSCDNHALFTLTFGEGKGELLGTYDNVQLWFMSDYLDTKVLSAEQYETYSAMQEDVNVILEHLYEDEKFELSVGNDNSEQETT